MFQVIIEDGIIQLVCVKQKQGLNFWLLRVNVSLNIYAIEGIFDNTLKYRFWIVYRITCFYISESSVWLLTLPFLFLPCRKVCLFLALSFEKLLSSHKGISKSERSDYVLRPLLKSPHTLEWFHKPSLNRLQS